MTVTVTRIYKFEAAHKLPKAFCGPATRLHGHSYTVRIEMPHGFRTEDLDAEWKKVAAAKLDHRFLNDHFEDTTVEGLAKELLYRFEAVSVEVQEGEVRFGRATP